MANNQITPFQLTDQFTMDNFNQRINETNTALQNNDPRKWGIGTNAVIPSGRSANNITADGLYYCDVDTPTGSDWLVYHAQRDDNWAVQLAVCSNAVEYGLVIRKKMSGVWKPWEWVNPPMELGVEYRTTERYQGKPVYVKLVDFGALPNATAKSVSHNVENINKCLDVTLVGLNGSTFTHNNHELTVYANGTTIYIKTTTNLSMYSVYATLKYTK